MYIISPHFTLGLAPPSSGSNSNEPANSWPEKDTARGMNSPSIIYIYTYIVIYIYISFHPWPCASLF